MLYKQLDPLSVRRFLALIVNQFSAGFGTSSEMTKHSLFKRGVLQESGEGVTTMFQMK